MKNFDGLGLHRVLAKSLAHMKYDTPTAIQAKAIPIALQGRDIMGSAQTGTGKTAAFAIPLVEALLRDERKSALVMTPTRELGKQVMDVMRQLIGPKSSIQTAFLIGGEPMGRQYAQLTRRPRLVVGTPGRINDHLDRGNLDLSSTTFLVLDETDRMLDMGFTVQIDRVIKHMPKQRQTLMFSATMPKNILQMADKYQDNPERIAVGSTFNPAKNIDQKIIRVDQDKKHKELTRELNDRDGSIIVFMKTKRNADRMAKKLNAEGHSAEAIHGDLQQRKRDRVIQGYRAKKFRILVATDVIARGLDIPHVEHVINYDLPQMPEDYIHRIGRTARAGATGSALCLIAPHDGRLWFEIEKLMNPDKQHEKGGQSFNDNRKKPSRGRKFNKGKPESRRRDGRKSEERKFQSSDERAEKTGGFKKSEGFKKKKSFKPRTENTEFSEGKPKKDRAAAWKDRNKTQDRDGDKPQAKRPKQAKPNGAKTYNGKPKNGGKRTFSGNDRPRRKAA